VIVLEKNGRAIVITGWRAWLVAAALMVGVSLLMALIVFVILGVAITIGAMLLIILPVVVGIAIIASALQSPRQ
jgi:hypothetical protein